MAKLRLDQWPAASEASGERELLRPDTLIQAIPGLDQWEWLVADGLESLDLSGGAGYAQIVGWYAGGNRVSTDRLVAELRKGNHQLNWGALHGRPVGQTEDVVIIAAFDSTWYDIEGPDAVIEGLTDYFAWARSHLQ